jgi:hypothetical protein
MYLVKANARDRKKPSVQLRLITSRGTLLMVEFVGCINIAL